MNPIETQQELRQALLSNKFTEIAPHTLQYLDQRDVITVFFHPHVIILTHDGQGVLPNWNLFPVYEGGEGQPWIDGGWDQLHQLILSRF
jgi:hypothetical protein